MRKKEVSEPETAEGENKSSQSIVGQTEDMIEAETIETENENSQTLANQEKEKKEPSELEKVKSELEEKAKEVEDLEDRYLRLKAETENFKRRMREEKTRDAQFANERLIKNILPIYENLDRALAVPDASVESLKQGLDMIFKEFTSLLEKEKVKLIPTVGESFDPAMHEAISQVESETEDNNLVLQEVSKGFFINDRVLRPARVIISKKASQPKTTEKKTSTVETDDIDGSEKSGEQR